MSFNVRYYLLQNRSGAFLAIFSMKSEYKRRPNGTIMHAHNILDFPPLRTTVYHQAERNEGG